MRSYCWHLAQHIHSNMRIKGLWCGLVGQHIMHSSCKCSHHANITLELLLHKGIMWFYDGPWTRGGERERVCTMCVCDIEWMWGVTLDNIHQGIKKKSRNIGNVDTFRSDINRKHKYFNMILKLPTKCFNMILKLPTNAFFTPPDPRELISRRPKCDPLVVGMLC